MGRILVINPNSSCGVTEAIAEALAPLGDRFDCVTSDAGPATISTAEHVARAGLAVADIARARPEAAAVIVACFSDPGLDLLHAESARPAFGVQEASLLTAMARADLFGIIALGPAPIVRHRQKMRAMGILGRLAGEVPLSGVSALDAGRSDAVYVETLAAGERLTGMGAGAIVLGCAGFGPRRRTLEASLGVPVIDPVLAAAGMALGALAG